MSVKSLDTEADMQNNLNSKDKHAMMERISRTVAHEIRNPLTNINLALEQLKSEFKDNSEAELYLSMIGRNSVRINQIVTDLQNATRPPQLAFDKKHINELLDESLALARERIKEKEIKVEKHFNEDCELSVDVQKMRVAFFNIILNAIDAMDDKKGLLAINTNAKSGNCIITISDNGKGIEPENINRIFDPYYTNKPHGSGLGLTQSQNIILSHKASISVQSNLGKGTTFTIVFTLRQQ